MKSRFLNPGLLLAAICCAALTVTAVRADEGDDEQGGAITGSESLDFEIAMTPTADAPAGSSIKASLEAEDEDGATNSKLKLETQGLPAGTYSVSVTLKSDGSTVPLGSFTINPTPTPTATPTPSPSASPVNDDDGENDGEDNGDDGQDSGSGEHGCEFGNGTSLPFPPGFNPFDIATISVSDASSTVLFTADLTTTSGASTMSFSASIKATPGGASSGVSGSALLTTAATRGNSRGSLQLTVNGLPPKMPLIFAVNGAAIKSLTANRSGNVNVMLKTKGKSSSLPGGVNLLNVTSVGLHDKNGHLIIGASF